MTEMVSSHTIKRFMQSLALVRVWLFRKILQRLFLWRLQKEQPELIKIGLDTMVMDNDEALKRVGVEPTYKKVKGFQPLQMYWGRYIIDESLFKIYEELKIGFVVGGKMYNDIKECIINLEDDKFLEYTRNRQTWLFCEFLDRRKSWNTI